MPHDWPGPPRREGEQASVMATREDLEQWLARVAMGDRAAFSSLYDATSAKLFGVCLRILKNRAGAEDALQETFMKVWRFAGSYTANGVSPMTWLITIARNTAVDRLRRHRDTQDVAPLADRLSDPAPSPEASAIARSEAARIAECLDELETDRARAVRGAYLDGLSYNDLSRALNVPLNTIRTWLRRSLISLRECMSR